MDEIKKTMLAMKNEKDAATDKADQLETTYLEAKEEQDKVSISLCLMNSCDLCWILTMQVMHRVAFDVSVILSEKNTKKKKKKTKKKSSLAIYHFLWAIWV